MVACFSLTTSLEHLFSCYLSLILSWGGGFFGLATAVPYPPSPEFSTSHFFFFYKFCFFFFFFFFLFFVFFFFFFFFFFTPSNPAPPDPLFLCCILERGGPLPLLLPMRLRISSRSIPPRLLLVSSGAASCSRTRFAQATYNWHWSALRF